MDARTAAARVVTLVMSEGASLTTALPAILERVAPGDRALVQELSYGTLRWAQRLEPVLAALLSKPLKSRDHDVRALLLTGLYQLVYMRIAPHAAVAETVSATRTLGKSWAAGLVNAVLRGFQRRREALLAAADGDDCAALSHPRWLVERLRRQRPKEWREILAANNQRAPMTLRVNAQQLSRDDYQVRLREVGVAARPAPHTTHGLVLETPMDVQSLPGFAQGWVSVQDAAAQLAAPLLAPLAGERLLDACAAPGGKSAHLLELQPELSELVAVDSDEARLARVRDNLDRLGLHATLYAADAAVPETWWDGRLFDRILLDAPCSATGVIRRHPDIKHLRRDTDIATLVTTQSHLLAALWPLLRAGGMLLYATCSILPEEDEQQVARFLDEYPDARVVPLTATWGMAVQPGRLILPGRDDMDGFFYMCISKQERAD